MVEWPSLRHQTVRNAVWNSEITTLRGILWYRIRSSSWNRNVPVVFRFWHAQLKNWSNKKHCTAYTARRHALESSRGPGGRAESSRLRESSKARAERLKHMRWPLLRRGTRVRGRARQKLNALLVSKLATARAWELKEIFSHFWKYKSVIWAGAFLDYWCFRALRSRLEPMQKVARMLRTHEELLLNWFRAKCEISAGVVEGLNNKIRVVTTILRFPHLRSHGVRPLSHARTTSGTRISP
jgi:Transposase